MTELKSPEKQRLLRPPLPRLPCPPPKKTREQVKIDHPAAADNVDSSTVTVEIVVASEADGYAVLTYVLSAVEGSSSSGGGGGGGSSTGAGVEPGGGLTSALNEALQGRTTTNCLCVAAPLSDDGGGGGGYDCSACEEGAAFSTARSVTTSRYDLLSADRDSGRSPVSVFDSGDSSGDDDMFWGGFAGGRAIRGIIRSDSYFDMAGVVVAVVCFTCLGLFSLRRCPGEADDEVRRRLSSTLGGRGNFGDLTVSPRGSKTRLSGADTLSLAGWKQHRGSGDSRGGFTPGATPAS